MAIREVGRRSEKEIETREDIVDNIPNINLDPMSYYRKYVKKATNKFKFEQINMSELRKIINKMKKSSSVGYDNISINMIKSIRKAIEPIILRIVNLVIRNNKFPEDLGG